MKIPQCEIAQEDWNSGDKEQMNVADNTNWKKKEKSAARTTKHLPMVQ